MNLADFKRASPQNAASPADSWNSTLARIPSVFGRLVYLASLRDSLSGKYRHAALAASLGDEGADRTLCRMHQQLFSEWLAFNLAEQKSDLDEYRTNAEIPGNSSQFLALAPRTARDVERLLFLTDLETLVELPKADGGSFPIPEAWPPQSPGR